MNLSSETTVVVLPDDPRANELRAVLASDPGLRALLAAARDRFAQSGSWTTKTIALNTPDLRAAAKALGFTNVGARLAMRKLGELLGRTRFGCTAEEAVRWAFGDVPATRDQRAAAAYRTWAAQRAEIISLAGPATAEIITWLDACPAVLRRAWMDPKLFDAARLAARAAAATKDVTTPEIVPVLANRLSDDPHALDVGRPARRYLERILVARHTELNLHHPLSANQRASLLAASGLAADGISSQVWAVGLMSSDPMVTAAREQAHVLGLPLVTLNAIPDVSAYGNVAFAVENRSVFGALLPVIASLPADQRPTLLCTSGNPSLAARVLLQRLAAGGVVIYYGGDTDTRGLAIARAITTLVGAGYRAWHMDGDSDRVRYQESSVAAMAADLHSVSASGSERCLSARGGPRNGPFV